jgi:predicted nucleic acid-binding protein
MRFVDTMVFIKWGQATLTEALQNEETSTCGYILTKIRDGEEALTSGLVKDEALIWFSRYRASRLSDFIRSLTALTHIKIAEPTLEDELEAAKLYGRYPLGISDLISLSIMKRHGVNEIYSADKGFEQVSTLKRVFEELRSELGYQDFITKLKSRC